MTTAQTKSLNLDSQTLIDLLRAWNPEDDAVLVEPEANEPGYWVGCPGVFVDGEDTYITYRQRRPRGQGAERGWHCGILKLERGESGYTTTEVWSIHKDELATASMERFAINRRADGKLELYISYVDPADDRWRVDVMTADSVSDFDPATRSTVLTAAGTETEGVKDPFIVRKGDAEWMFLSVAQTSEIPDHDAAHGTKDIFNTQYAKSATGLAIRSAGSSEWVWRGYVLSPAAPGAWDQNTRRLNSIVKVTDGYLGFYDGKDSHEGNYEELTGLAFSENLTDWKVLTTDDPIITSNSPTGSLRYIDFRVLPTGELELIYEITRQDQSHEMRTHIFS
jgi:hypothetical protein